jgi:hypothetical protein
MKAKKKKSACEINPIGMEFHINNDRLSGTLNIRFTHEGIIMDLLDPEGREVVKTMSMMWDEIEDGLLK